MADEKLAAVGVWTCIGHRERARLVVLLHRFIGELVPWSTGPGASRIAALDHEPLDDAVERRAVVIPVLCQVDKIVDGVRRFLWVELHVKRTMVGFKRRGVR